MALTRKSAAGVIIGLAALVGTLGNPNYQTIDIVSPSRVVRKLDSRIQYDGSGIMYGLAYAAVAASAIGLGYNALTGNLKQKPKD